MLKVNAQNLTNYQCISNAYHFYSREQAQAIFDEEKF